MAVSPSNTGTENAARIREFLAPSHPSTNKGSWSMSVTIQGLLSSTARPQHWVPMRTSPTPATYSSGRLKMIYGRNTVPSTQKSDAPCASAISHARRTIVSRYMFVMRHKFSMMLAMAAHCVDFSSPPDSEVAAANTTELVLGSPSGASSNSSLMLTTNVPPHGATSSQPKTRNPARVAGLVERGAAQIIVRLRKRTPCIALPRSPSLRSSRFPNAAGLLGVHGLAFGACKRLAELFEVLHAAIHAHPSH
jgi:hypothetical protein